MGFEFLVQALQIAMGLPTVGKILVFALGILPTLGTISTTIVMVWHGLVAILSGISEIPGCQKLQALAQRLKAADSKVDDFEQNKILPVLNRLSAIPLPQKAAPAPAPVAAPAV